VSKFIVTPDIIQKLYDAGLIAEEPSYVRRVIFDFKAGQVGMMYIEKFADDVVIDTLLEAKLHVATPGEEVERVGMHMRDGSA
jgi:hypothetical protein